MAGDGQIFRKKNLPYSAPRKGQPPASSPPWLDFFSIEKTVNIGTDEPRVGSFGVARRAFLRSKNDRRCLYYWWFFRYDSVNFTALLYTIIRAALKILLCSVAI